MTINRKIIMFMAIVMMASMTGCVKEVGFGITPPSLLGAFFPEFKFNLKTYSPIERRMLESRGLEKISTACGFSYDGLYVDLAEQVIHIPDYLKQEKHYWSPEDGGLGGKVTYQDGEVIIQRTDKYEFSHISTEPIRLKKGTEIYLIAQVKNLGINKGQPVHERGKFQAVIWLGNRDLYEDKEDFVQVFDWRWKVLKISNPDRDDMSVQFRIGIQNAIGEIHVKNMMIFKKSINQTI